MTTKATTRRRYAQLAPRRYTRRQFGGIAAGATVLAAMSSARLTRRANASPQSHGLEQIQHVIVMMQENHSFDDYFARLHFLGQPDTEAEPANASNPDPLNPSGPPITAFHHTDMCEVADLDHSWSGTHRSWHGGLMDGFTAANVDPLDPSGRRAMGYHTNDELPFYYGLYSTFPIGDRYFSSLMGPTIPNRLYLLAATSFGHIRDDVPHFLSDPNAFAPPNGTIFEQMDRIGVSWKVYYAELPFAVIFGYVRHHPWHLAPMSQYYDDARTGQLPQVSFVDPGFFGGAASQTDEHPPVNVQLGQAFVAAVISALFTSPLWSSSALFLTYDEHGGYYDHVPPPPAPMPDAIAPLLQSGDEPGAFDRYGIRVPAVVVSPFARPRHVSHVVHDHTSILRFIETRFNLPALTNRDAQADPMLEFFDFSSPSFKRPPTLPAARIDPAAYLACLRMQHASTTEEGMSDLRSLWGGLSTY